METPQKNSTLTPSPSPTAGEGSSNQNKTSPKKVDRAALISLSLELGYIIAIPLVVLGLLGKWIDDKLGNEFPAMTLIGIVLAIASTTFWITKKVRNYIK